MVPTPGLVGPNDPWSAHLSLLYAERALPDRVRAAAAGGFRWVESWWIDDDATRAAFLDEVRATGLGLACLNAYAGDLERGHRGLLNAPSARDTAMQAVAAAVAEVASVAGRAVNVLVGVADPDVPVARQLAGVRDALRELGPVAGAAGVTLAVEHLNPSAVPGYLLPAPADARRLVEAVGDPHVRVLLDAGHAAAAGLDPAAEAAASAGLIGHAQYSDPPGRAAPGTGDGDPWGFARAVAEAGYAGPIGLEYDPRGDTAATLRALALLRGSGFA